MTYKDGRPVFYDLPQKGYQDNPTVDWLTRWYDQKLVQVATLMETLWQYLEPEEAPESYLDYLAFLCGLSGTYWDTKWQPDVKRQLIKHAHKLWSSRGTLGAIQKVLEIHNIEHTIWSSGSLRLPFELPRMFGRDDLRIWVRLPLPYQRQSWQFKESQRTLRNYAPTIVQTGVCFNRFYLGFSVLGDPLFSN